MLVFFRSCFIMSVHMVGDYDKLQYTSIGHGLKDSTMIAP